MQVSLVLFVCSLVAAIILSAFTLYAVQGVVSGSLSEDEFDAFTVFAGPLGDLSSWVGLGVHSICILTYLLFVYFAARNIERSKARGLSHSPLGVVIWSLVPVVNLFKIYQTLGEIWQASHDPVRGAYATPILMPIWWSLYVGANVAGRVAARQMNTTSVDSFVFAVWLDMASSVALIVSTILLIMIVGSIKQAQVAWASVRPVPTRSTAANALGY